LSTLTAKGHEFTQIRVLFGPSRYSP